MKKPLKPLVLPTIAKTPNPNKEIHEVLVIDRSGSMQNIWNPVIESVNNYIKKIQQAQSEDGLTTYCSILLFDDKIESILSNSSVLEAKPIDPTAVKPRGSTALNDAIGKAIKLLKSTLAGRENSPDIDVTISIFTDGWENASILYPGKGNPELFSYIKEIQESFGWVINFTGAGNAEQVAKTATQDYGIHRNAVQSYQPVGSALHDGSAATCSFSLASDAQLSKRAAFAAGHKQPVGSYFSQAKDNNTVASADNNVATNTDSSAID